MNTPIARVVTRMQGEGDGLFLGAILKQGAPYFLPSSVYELQYNSLSGDITLVYKGVALPANVDQGETYKVAPMRVTWAEDISDILGKCGKELFLTREEYKAIQEAWQREH